MNSLIHLVQLNFEELPQCYSITMEYIRKNRGNITRDILRQACKNTTIAHNVLEELIISLDKLDYETFLCIPADMSGKLARTVYLRLNYDDVVQEGCTAYHCVVLAHYDDTKTMGYVSDCIKPNPQLVHLKGRTGTLLHYVCKRWSTYSTKPDLYKYIVKDMKAPVYMKDSYGYIAQNYLPEDSPIHEVINSAWADKS